MESSVDDIIVLEGDFEEEINTQYIIQRVQEAGITDPWVARYSDNWMVYHLEDPSELCRRVIDDDIDMIDSAMEDWKANSETLHAETNGELLFSSAGLVNVYNDIIDQIIDQRGEEMKEIEEEKEYEE